MSYVVVLFRNIINVLKLLFRQLSNLDYDSNSLK